jgi:hypothetical protein
LLRILFAGEQLSNAQAQIDLKLSQLFNCRPQHFTIAINNLRHTRVQHLPEMLGLLEAKCSGLDSMRNVL